MAARQAVGRRAAAGRAAARAGCSRIQTLVSSLFRLLGFPVFVLIAEIDAFLRGARVEDAKITRGARDLRDAAVGDVVSLHSLLCFAVDHRVDRVGIGDRIGQ